MNWETLSQLSVGVASVGVLGYVVRLFLTRLKDRDIFLEKLIDNHFHASQERDAKLMRGMDKLIDKIDRL